MSPVVVQADIVTAWGLGTTPCWNGLLTGRSAFSLIDRFNTQTFQTHNAALIPGLTPTADTSLVMQMLRPLLAPLAGTLPKKTLVILASTTGEVELLERHCLGANIDASESHLTQLLGRVTGLLGVSDGCVISAACVSSSAAIAQGAALLASGEREAVLIVACDAVTEFVFAGFSSLMALDPEGARPFDRSRKGLTVGEAAGTILLMSEMAAASAHRPILGRIAGWGLSGDANHMTGPSRDGSGLVRAIEQALSKASMAPEAIGSISAHGTGTLYNDSMELKAFNRVFANSVRPVYSVKGSIGHTMGAAGLVETIIALESLKAAVIPPSANLNDIDPEAEGWVHREAIPAPAMNVVLSTNSGFGGVNSALIITP